MNLDEDYGPGKLGLYVSEPEEGRDSTHNEISDKRRRTSTRAESSATNGTRCIGVFRRS